MHIGIGISPTFRSLHYGVFTQSITNTLDDGHDQVNTWDDDGFNGFIIAGIYWGAVCTGITSFDTGGSVPKNSTIISATLTVDVIESAGSPAITFACEDADTSARPSGSNQPKDMTITTARTLRTDAASVGLVDVDITSSVQEVVNRAGLTEGVINVITKDLTGSGDYWHFKDYEHSSGTNPAKLVVTWSP